MVIGSSLLRRVRYTLEAPLHRLFVRLEGKGDARQPRAAEEPPERDCHRERVFPPLGQDQNVDEEWSEAATEVVAQIEHRQRCPARLWMG